MGLIVRNRYYTDAGTEYCLDRLESELGKLGLPVRRTVTPLCGYCGTEAFAAESETDFAVFWDKDVAAARVLERNKDVFNAPHAIEICDDKLRTYAAVAGQGVDMPETVVAPLAYDVSEGEDEALLSLVERLSYPIVVKQNVGSQGKQVYLASDRAELAALHKRLMHVPHHFQRFYADSAGSDIRLYMVGGRCVAACRRQNTTSFRSNVAMGGEMFRIEPRPEFVAAAERVAARIGLDFGSVDFLDGDRPVLIEVNSNAYFRGIEQSGGADIAGAYARHIAEKISC